MNKDEIIETILRDLVDMSIQSKKVLANANMTLENMHEAHLLNEMADEILKRYTKAKEKKKETPIYMDGEYLGTEEEKIAIFKKFEKLIEDE